MYNFLGGYLYIYLVCEYRLSYYHLRSILLGTYATIVILLDLCIIGKAMRE